MRLSWAQVLGAVLVLAAGGFGLVQVIVGFVEGTVSLEPLTSGYDPGALYWGILVQAAGRVVGTLAALLAVVGLAGRSSTALRAAGGVSILGGVVIAGGEIAVVVGASGYRYEAVTDVVVGWVWGYLGLIGLFAAGFTLVVARAVPVLRDTVPRDTDPRRTSMDPSGRVGTPPPPTTDPVDLGRPTSYFIAVEGTEYGPFSADEIRHFVDEGRVVAETLIRPEFGHYEPARVVPGLVPGA